MLKSAQKKCHAGIVPKSGKYVCNYLTYTTLWPLGIILSEIFAGGLIFQNEACSLTANSYLISMLVPGN
jgi:hypothetical protein